MKSNTNSNIPEKEHALGSFDYLNHDYLKKNVDKFSDDKNNQPENNHATIWLMIFAGLIIIFIVLFFVTIVFSLNQVKPPVPLPVNKNASTASYDEASYLLNQLGFYKLHSNLFNQHPPIVNLYILNTNQSFSYSFVNSVFTVVNRQLDNPDVAIYTNLASFKELVYSKDPITKIKTMIQNNNVVVRAYSSKYSLLMKGYYPLNFLFTKD